MKNLTLGLLIHQVRPSCNPIFRRSPSKKVGERPAPQPNVPYVDSRLPMQSWTINRPATNFWNEPKKKGSIRLYLFPVHISSFLNREGARAVGLWPPSAPQGGISSSRFRASVLPTSRVHTVDRSLTLLENGVLKWNAPWIITNSLSEFFRSIREGSYLWTLLLRSL